MSTVFKAMKSAPKGTFVDFIYESLRQEGFYGGMFSGESFGGAPGDNNKYVLTVWDSNKKLVAAVYANDPKKIVVYDVNMRHDIVELVDSFQQEKDPSVGFEFSSEKV